ncbi:hypothetical protein IE53DRAFT_379414 [Violaceomyces palustris]|uniref:Uncharacterized protein n=1 Tax=Violaceomyces palustris TaxID=1673888 RepID=A0ACD0NYL3_9BASI|nr:hypothetical protein IE53DRAFT_379414 [Violaceomyces palustris]
MTLIDRAPAPPQERRTDLAAGVDLMERDPGIIAESSRQGAALGKRQHPKDTKLQARQPDPHPAPGPNLHASSPTPAPRRRAADEPEHFRIGAQFIEERKEKLSEAESRDARPSEEILGPFWARSQDDVLRVKRELKDLNRRREFKRLAKQGADLRPRRRWLENETWEARSPDSWLKEDDVRRWETEQSRYYADRAIEERDRALASRQTAAEEQCFVGNEQLSCYPTEGSQIVQDTWSRFIWNANYPSFTQFGLVDVYLFHEDNDSQVTSWTNLDNGAGRLSFRPVDSWWQGRVRADNIQPGQNISWPFYFVITAAGVGLSGTTTRLATWDAIQTALPVAVSSSRAAASASASSASAASASAAAAASLSSLVASQSLATATLTGAAASSASASRASEQSALASSLSSALVSSLRGEGLTGTETLAGTATATFSDGNVVTATATVQANGGSLSGSGGRNNAVDSGLPTYAIVLIAVFAFLAFVAGAFGLYFLMAAMRKKRQRLAGQRGSMGSGSPMMAAAVGPAAGSLAGASTEEGANMTETSAMLGDAAGTGTGAAVGAGAGFIAAGGVRSLGSSSRHRPSADEDAAAHPFTSDEATRMADAFRNALRKPEFAPSGFRESGIDEGDGESPMEGSGGSPGPASELLREELASEGKDLRDVGDRKKPTWHNDV